MEEGMNIISKAKYVLLTGAGFTKNFGGFLSSEMWAQIFNQAEIQQNVGVRNQMLSKFNYEEIYSIIMRTDRSTEEDKHAIQTAIIKAYKKQDLIIARELGRASAHWGLVNNFIQLFALNQIGFFFTTNQDIFIERYLKDLNSTPLGMKTNESLTYVHPPAPPPEVEYLTCPKKEDIEAQGDDLLSKSNFFYIKLHGSQDWKSSTGSDVMVIGFDKEKKIQEEPILLWYHELFKNVLYQKNIRLLVIGYGFQDEYINDIIIEAITGLGLKVFVICPENPRDFRNRLLVSPSPTQIWYEGLTGYYPFSLSEIFPKMAVETEIYRDIKSGFFS